MKINVRLKIIGLAVIAASLPMVVMVALNLLMQQRITSQTREEFRKMVMANVAQIVGDARALCQMADRLISGKLTTALNVAREIVRQGGGLSQAEDTWTWQATNQFTGETRTIALPRLALGAAPLPQNASFQEASPVVDEVKRLVGGTCTLFQRMNAAGDMLRVVTNVPATSGSRAIGTYAPAIGADNAPNPVIAAVLSGKTYQGLAWVVNAWYLTRYEPLRSRNGEIIGMLYVGERLEAEQSLRQALESIKIGRTGYVFALGTKGTQKGTYIVSRDGQRDGENIWDVHNEQGFYPARDLFAKAETTPKGQIFFHEYAWKDPGEQFSRMKISAVVYFEPWDWLLGAGAYEDEFLPVEQRIAEISRRMLIELIIAGVLVMAACLIVAIFMTSRLVRPLELAMGVARKIAAGNLAEARQELSIAVHPAKVGAAPGDAEFALSDKHKIQQPIWSALKLDTHDETHQLLDSLRSMTESLKSLIGQVQRTGIQVTSSANEIAASARSLEATVTEQASATRQVTVTGKEIAGNSEALSKMMTQVGGTVEETVLMAESGRHDLELMGTTIRQLMQATASISSRLTIINDRANKISGVVTTINKVSDQTNLLSLNAAIEAEKAGEYGRGFSVVAREIGRLADQTAVATQDIEDVVREMQSSVTSGVMEMDKFTDEVRRSVEEIGAIAGKLSKVIERVREVSPSFLTVQEGMHEQSEGAQQISEAMRQLSETADQNREALHEFKLATDQLNGAIQLLKDEVDKFKTG